MTRDYIIGNFNKDYEKTVELLKDKNISYDSRLDIALDFCSYYIFFDINKFNKYL